jgi:hypothetical protein
MKEPLTTRQLVRALRHRRDWGNGDRYWMCKAADKIERQEKSLEEAIGALFALIDGVNEELDRLGIPDLEG